MKCVWYFIHWHLAVDGLAQQRSAASANTATAAGASAVAVLAGEITAIGGQAGAS